MCVNPKHVMTFEDNDEIKKEQEEKIDTIVQDIIDSGRKTRNLNDGLLDHFESTESLDSSVDSDNSLSYTNQITPPENISAGKNENFKLDVKDHESSIGGNDFTK